MPVFADSSWIVADTLRFTLPDLRLTFSRGALTALYDSAQSLTGLLFEGEAQINFRPRPALERFQLMRFTRDSVLHCVSSRVLLRVSETASLSAEMNGERLPWSAWRRTPLQQKSKNRREAEELHKTWEEALRRRNNLNVASRLLTCKIEAGAEFVACAFYPDHSRHFSPPLYTYVYDTNALETVSFYTYFPKRIGRQFFTVCSYAPSQAAAPDTVTAKLTKYNGWVALDEDGFLNADMGVDLFTGAARPRALSFAMAADLRVTKVLTETGEALELL